MFCHQKNRKTLDTLQGFYFLYAVNFDYFADITENKIVLFSVDFHFYKEENSQIDVK